MPSEQVRAHEAGTQGGYAETIAAVLGSQGVAEADEGELRAVSGKFGRPKSPNMLQVFTT